MPKPNESLNMADYRVDAYFLNETDTVLASAHVSPFRGIESRLLGKKSLVRLMCDRPPLSKWLEPRKIGLKRVGICLRYSLASGMASGIRKGLASGIRKGMASGIDLYDTFCRTLWRTILFENFRGFVHWTPKTWTNSFRSMAQTKERLITCPTQFISFCWVLPFCGTSPYHFVQKINFHPA